MIKEYEYKSRNILNTSAVGGTVETPAQRKAREHREDLQRLRGLRPIDDDFMRGLFYENLPLAQMVLRIILNRDDLVLTSCVTQADMKRVTGARSICLDAYGTDSSGKKYDMEVQRSDLGADPHRARYHSSVMDVENLDAGQEFSELPDTYTIFITEDDFYGRGEPFYLFQWTDAVTGEPFGDGASILYVNGKYRGDDAIGRLMHDFNCTDADEMNYKLLADRTRYLKESQKGVEMMCRSMEEMRDRAKEEGRVEGRVEGRAEGGDRKLIEQVVRKLSQGKHIAAIADDLGEETSVVRQICEAVQSCAPEYDNDRIYQRLIELREASGRSDG